MKLSTRAATRGLATGLLILGLLGIAGCDSDRERVSTATTSVQANTSTVASADATSYPDNHVNEPFTVPGWFRSINQGMTYDEVVDIIGGDGELLSPDPFGPPGQEQYVWGAGGGFVFVGFDDGLVTWASAAGGP